MVSGLAKEEKSSTRLPLITNFTWRGEESVTEVPREKKEKRGAEMIAENGGGTKRRGEERQEEKAKHHKEKK